MKKLALVGIGCLIGVINLFGLDGEVMIQREGVRKGEVLVNVKREFKYVLNKSQKKCMETKAGYDYPELLAINDSGLISNNLLDGKRPYNIILIGYGSNASYKVTNIKTNEVTWFYDSINLETCNADLYEILTSK